MGDGNGLEWVRASDSPEGESIEVATGDGDLVHIRSTDDPDNIVTTTVAKWKAFVLGVQNDEFDHFVDDGPESP
ncbi:DUF397 domain-containing protein [Streptomyces sp. 7N604]|uniref:DUF397 domain-containing protein n=1 Tax=Streptomyces sp. 7N604 TaxID=3457415 RepID=UPI003FD060E8